jgi:hypothetical protein
VDHEVEVTEKCVVTSIIEWIEDTHLDIGMSAERQDLLIAGNRITVVYQDSHARPAAGGALERLGDEESRFVAAKDEVLHIDGSFRGIDHLNPGD